MWQIKKLPFYIDLIFCPGVITGYDDLAAYRMMADKQFTIRIPVGFMVVYRIYPEPPLYHAFYVCREKNVFGWLFLLFYLQLLVLTS